MSDPQMPQEWTRTTTSSGPGCGTVRSTIVITPGDWYTAAAMTSGNGPPDVEPDMGVRLRVRLQPGEPSAQVAQEDGEFPGQREVAQGRVERAGRAVFDAPGQREAAVGHAPAGCRQVDLALGQTHEDPGVGPE